MNISAIALSDDKTWESLGPVAQAGTVYSVAVSPLPEVDRCWAATGCGIFFSDNGGKTWIQSLTGLTTPLLGALVVSPNGALLAGSLNGDLFTSFDYGESWAAGIVPVESKGTITSLAISPNFRTDGCAFAATDGAGLLVTRSSGHLWEDSSFGLGSDSVLALATAPDWSRKETMFAATLDGVYVSQNGGRAWRETGLELDDEDVVDVLVISPNFEHDHTLFAGTENGRLFRYDDKKSGWVSVNADIGDGPVNCLWLDPDFANTHRILAGVGNKIVISNDNGKSWDNVSENQGTVLAIAGSSKLTLAGLQDGGVLVSPDGGTTWSSTADSLACRGFSKIIARSDCLFVLGPQEGISCSQDAGHSWSTLPGLEPYLPVTTMIVASIDELLVVSQTEGILHTTDHGATWQVVFKGEGIRVLAVTAGGYGLAGTLDGKLLATYNDGAEWVEVPTPCNNQEILNITFSPNFLQDHIALMGTSIAANASQQARVALWRSTNGGVNWRQVTTQVTTARWLDIALPLGVNERAVDQAIMATGPFCLRPLRRAKDVWISTRVDPAGTNALAVVALGEIDSGGLLYVATGNGVFRSIDGGRTWHAFLQPEEAASFISLSAAYEGDHNSIYALSLGGRIFKHSIS
jgi:photosystem II stability/assembly factor-like uncharacterized protein